MHTSAEEIDPTPYGEMPPPPDYPPTARREVTRRGRAALGVGAVVIAGGGLIGYQAYTSHEAKERDTSLSAQALELQKTREVNKAAKERQKDVDACVEARPTKDPAAYRAVVDACQAQYAEPVSGSDMKTAGSEQGDVPVINGGGGLLVVSGLAVGLAVVAKRGRREAK